MTWKAVKGFEGLYEINENAEVKSLVKERRHVSRILHNVTFFRTKERILKPGKDAEGYIHYVLRKRRQGLSHQGTSSYG